MSEKHSHDSAVSIWQLQTDLLTNHGINLTERSFCINEEIEQKLFDTVNMKMSILERDSTGKDAPITIRLHSLGGDVYTAWAIVSRLKSSPCKIIVEAHGVVASAATLILAAADIRKVSRFCTVMFHEASIETAGKLSDLQDSVNVWKKEEKMYIDFLAKVSKKPSKFWANMIQSNKDTYLTGPELLKLGLIDEVF